MYALRDDPETEHDGDAGADTEAAALDRAIAVGDMAVAETGRILMGALAERIRALADAACGEIDKAHAAAARVGLPGQEGEWAVNDVERCGCRAEGMAREAKQRRKQYAKLAARHG